MNKWEVPLPKLSKYQWAEVANEVCKLPPIFWEFLNLRSPKLTTLK